MNSLNLKLITRQEWYGAFVAVLVLGLFLTVASPYFLTTGNLSNILVQASVVALLADRKSTRLNSSHS